MNKPEEKPKSCCNCYCFSVCSRNNGFFEWREKWGDLFNKPGSLREQQGNIFFDTGSLACGIMELMAKHCKRYRRD